MTNWTNFLKSWNLGEAFDLEVTLNTGETLGSLMMDDETETLEGEGDNGWVEDVAMADVVAVSLNGIGFFSVTACKAWIEADLGLAGEDEDEG